MMNDRFSAQLRQHLLNTADERPADGRLAAVVEGVAVTAQRHPLVARLPWFGGHADPFSSVAMRYGLIAVALIIAIVGAALAVGVGQPRPTVFDGTWTSIDPADGSTQTLVVGAGTGPAVHFEDSFATGAACVADEVKVFRMEGIGTITDGRLGVRWPEGGGCGATKVSVGPGVYTYIEATDTLVDGQGLSWARVQGSVVRPTSPPVTEPTPRSSPTADPDCIQFDVPGTYTAPVGSMSVTVSVPGTAGPPWHGHRSRFDLMKASCTDMMGTGLTLGAELTRVYTDGCADTSVPVDSAAAAVAAVSAAEGLEVVETSLVTFGGYPGTRLDITVSDAPNACPDQQIPLTDDLSPFDAGLNVTLYLIDVDGKTLALATYGGGWGPAVNADLDAMLASTRIEQSAPGTPSPSSDPPSGDCVAFDSPGSYTAPVGSLSLSVDVPGTAESTWHGLRDQFYLLKAPCLFGGPWIEGSIVSVVYPDACGRPGTGVTVDSAAETIAALAAVTGVDLAGPTDVTIGGYAGARFEITVPEDFVGTACGDGSVVVLDRVNNLEPGVTTIYVLDVEGTTLALAISGVEDEVPALTARFDEVLASMRIEARSND
jgi:hypothetical protein